LIGARAVAVDVSHAIWRGLGRFCIVRLKLARGMPMAADPITIAEYRGFQRAYDFFNTALFGAALPDLLVTLQRKAKTRGYFSVDRFRARTNDATTHELALNPDAFDGRTDEEILSTLAHEIGPMATVLLGEQPRRLSRAALFLRAPRRACDRVWCALR
jgi:hypothetical protein